MFVDRDGRLYFRLVKRRTTISGVRIEEGLQFRDFIGARFGQIHLLSGIIGQVELAAMQRRACCAAMSTRSRSCSLCGLGLLRLQGCVHLNIQG